jgi:hypothetical protein
MAPKVRAGATPVEERSKRGFSGRRPFIVKLKRRKKKAKYTKGLKELQVAFRRGTKVTDQVTDAVSVGVGQFEKKSKASSRKRKNGILRDIVPNAASGVSKGLRRSSKVPALAAKFVSDRGFGQRLVDGMRWLVRRLRGR